MRPVFKCDCNEVTELGLCWDAVCVEEGPGCETWLAELTSISSENSVD